jgi:stage III sporulation protein AH
MMVLKKRQIVIVSLIIMILIAGYLNWSYQNELDNYPIVANDVEDAPERLGEAELVINDDISVEEQDSSIVADSKDINRFFLEAHMDKERARSEAFEVLEEIVNNENSSEETKINAQEQMMALAKSIEKEAIIENLIKAKDFEDAVVFFDEGVVNVILPSGTLSSAQVAQIQDIVVSQTGLSADNIKIMEKSR